MSATSKTLASRWQQAGVWERVLQKVSASPDLQQVMLDATIVRVISTVRGKRGQHLQAIERSRGGITTKIHAVVDALGYPLHFELTGDTVMTR